MTQAAGRVNFLHLKLHEKDGEREIDIKVARFVCYGIGALLMFTVAMALKKHGTPFPSKKLWIALGLLGAFYFCPRTRPMALRIAKSVKGKFGNTQES